VFRHTLLVLQNAPPTIEGQLAALLHDVGKPKTQEILADSIHFYQHEDIGAEMAEAILYRLKFDSETTKKVSTMVRNHMRPHSLPDASEKALRKFIRDLGDEMAEAVVNLAEADEKASLGVLSTKGEIERLKQRLQTIKDSPVKVQVKPILKGPEVMEVLGILPSDRKRLPEIGKAQKFLMEVADDYASQGKQLTPDEARKELKDNFKP
jgi:putative nucleotidyltransferase with HDIG domain